MRIAAESQNWRMLKQKQCVSNEVLLPCSNHLLLDAHSLCIRDSAEMEKVDVHQNFAT